MFTFVNTLPYFVKMDAFSSYFRTLIRHFVNVSGFRIIMLNKKGLKIVTIIIAVLLIVAMVIPLVMTAYT